MRHFKCLDWCDIPPAMWNLFVLLVIAESVSIGLIWHCELPHAACCIIHPSAGRTCGFCVSLNSHHKDNMAVKATEEQDPNCASGGLCRPAVGKRWHVPRASAGEHLSEFWVCWTDGVWSQACSALYGKWLPLSAPTKLLPHYLNKILACAHRPLHIIFFFLFFFRPLSQLVVRETFF